jgi:hypothetical protein
MQDKKDKIKQLEEKRIEAIADRAHIKWLEKAETAEISGVELTVLPYGFLRQAILWVLRTHQAELVEAVREEERERIWVYLEEFLSISDLLKDDTDLKTISNIIFDKPKIK